MTDKFFYSIIGGFSIGIVVTSFLDFGFWMSIWFFAVAIVIVFYLQFVNKLNWRDRSTLFIIPVLIFSIGLGSLRMAIKNNTAGQSGLASLVGTKAVLKGIIVDEPDEREGYTQLTVLVSSGEEGEKKFKEKILVRADSFIDLKYGDAVQFSGKLEKPENFSSEDGRTFNYKAYLAKDGIGYVVSFAQVEKRGEGGGNWIIAELLQFKRAFLNRLGSLIPEPHASLLGGLIVGAKQALGKDLLNDFRIVGVIHIVVLSGYNITIVAESLMAFFKVFAPRIFATSLGVFSIIAFALMTGASATIVRASVMALLVIIARASSRRYDITRGLLLAGFLMLVHNPAILVFDPSFQLSFLATIGLIYVSPLVERRLGFIPEKLNLREVATATVATQIFVLPFILYQMGTLSVVALPVNLLILAAIPATMLFGFLAGMTGFISLALATPFAFTAYALLAYELGVVNWFANLPFASFAVPIFPFWIVILVYVVYFVIYRRVKYPTSKSY